MTRLSVPKKSGLVEEFASEYDASAAAARILGVDWADMVEVLVGDVTYCYASQSDADADLDGAYAVKYSVAA